MAARTVRRIVLQRNRFGLLWSGILPACLLLSGCVESHVPHYPIDSSPGIGERSIPADQLARDCGLRIETDIVGSSPCWKLVDGTNEVRIYPGSMLVWVNGERISLGRPVEVDQGIPQLPLWASRDIRSRLKPASPVEPVAARRLPARSSRIVIDAGHGGKDPGAIGRRGVREKDVVLDVCLQVAALLRGAGQTVLLTRNRDVFVELSERADFANRNGAELFISVHANSSVSGHLHGVEVFHPRWKDRGPADKQDIGPSQALARVLNGSLVAGTGASSNKVGVHHHSLAVLRKTRCPAVLVEVGYLSHSEEEAKLSQRDYRERIARAIADGILSYLEAGRVQAQAR